MPNPGKPKVNPKRMKEDVLNFDFERFTEEYSKLENLCKKLDEYDHALQEGRGYAKYRFRFISKIPQFKGKEVIIGKYIKINNSQNIRNNRN